MGLNMGTLPKQVFFGSNGANNQTHQINHPDNRLFCSYDVAVVLGLVLVEREDEDMNVKNIIGLLIVTVLPFMALAYFSTFLYAIAVYGFTGLMILGAHWIKE